MSLEGNAVPKQVVKGRINSVDILTISAYGIAVKNGFEGTEEEWLKSLEMSNEELEAAVNKFLSENPIAIDKTLTVSGQAADAKATGDAIAALQKTTDDTVNAHANNKENPHGVTAAQVGLGNVDNTADMDKPVSTAQAAAIKTAKTEAIDAARFAQTCVNEHMAARTNPHGVTAAQVGAVTASQVSTMINEALGVIENGTY